MATKSYVTYSPNSGSGETTVSVSAANYTGRIDRDTVTLIISDTSGQATTATPKTVTVKQVGKTEFVSMDSSSSGSVSTPNSTNLVAYLYCHTNSSKLTISTPPTPNGRNTLELVASNFTYKVTTADSETANGSAIPGDPGKSAEVAIRISVSKILVRKAVVGETLLCDITITDNAGNTQVVTLTMSGDTPTITVSKTSISIPADGTAQTFTITSNTNWTIS